MESIVQEHFEATLKYVADESTRRHEEFTRAMVLNSTRLRETLGSPLEMIFLLWWHAADRVNGRYELGLEPQAWVTVGDQKYRVDFLIVPYDLTPLQVAQWRPIAVEMDGHAFHERTREQVQLRDSRDRALTAAGWRVFHFSFSEFTANPARCVSEVMDFGHSQKMLVGASL